MLLIHELDEDGNSVARTYGRTYGTETRSSWKSKLFKVLAKVLALVVAAVVLLGVLVAVGAPPGVTVFSLIALIGVGAAWLEGGARLFRPSEWENPRFVLAAGVTMLALIVLEFINPS